MQFLCILLFVLAKTSFSFACPEISSANFPDINCDRKFKILFTGDSIVKGVGDTNNRGGYPKRIKRRYRRINVKNLGIPGITSSRLLRDFKQNLKKNGPGPTKKKSKHSDTIIIAVGVNDYWENDPVSFTVRNIRRLVKFLKKNRKFHQVKPKIFVATLLPVAPVNGIRADQNDFVNELNAALLAGKSSKLPVLLRLDTVSNSVMGSDGLHPTPAGYDTIADTVASFLETTARKKLRNVHRDRDNDGVYDKMETVLFGTNPLLTDTDGDSLTDGEELFNVRSDPLDVSSP